MICFCFALIFSKLTVMVKKIFILVFLLSFAVVDGQNRYAKYPKSNFVYDAQDWKSNTIEEIEEKFNEARYHEELDLGVDLPEFRFPSAWISLTDADKVLWLINKERHLFISFLLKPSFRSSIYNNT